MARNDDFLDKIDLATENIQLAAEAADDREAKARLVEARNEIGYVALEEEGMDFILPDE